MIRSVARLPLEREPGSSVPAVRTSPGAHGAGAGRRSGAASRRLVDVVVVLAVVAAACLPFPDPDYRPRSVLGFVVVLLPALTVPLRRRRPGVAVALCLVLYAAAALLQVIPLDAAIATAIATYSLAVESPTRRTTVVAAGGIMIALLVLNVLATLSGAFDPRTVQFVVGVAFAAAAGDATRSRREYIQAITDRAERAETSREAEARRRVTEERLRIARDLHDVVAHQIAVIGLNAGVASSALQTRPDRAREALGTIRGATRTVLREIGDLLAVLRADDPEETTGPHPGIVGELDRLVDEFAAVGMAVSIRVDGELGAVTGVTDLVAYRVVREALTNAHKHGSEHLAVVELLVSEDRLVIVVDNPTSAGPDPRPRSTRDLVGGYGLIGVRERVAAVRGKVGSSRTGPTWRLRAELPILTEDRP